MKTHFDEAILTYPGLSLHVYGTYLEGEVEDRYSPALSSEFEIREIKLIQGDLVDLLLAKLTIEKIEEDTISQIENNNK